MGERGEGEGERGNHDSEDNKMDGPLQTLLSGSLAFPDVLSHINEAC